MTGHRAAQGTPGLCLHQPGEGRETAQGLEAQGSDTLRSARKGSSRQGLLGPKALSAPDPAQWGRPEVTQRPPHLLQVPKIHAKL